MATFFAAAGEFAAWLEKHGTERTEFVVERARALRREGKMREAGLKAYSHRREIGDVFNAMARCSSFSGLGVT
jgi:hypothetical protein